MQAALALAAIDPEDERVAAAAVAVLVPELTPGAGGAAEGEVIDALAAIGLPAANGILQAVEGAKGLGVEKANQRAALLGVLEKLGRNGHSKENVAKLKELASSDKELYQNVRTAAVRARRAMEK